MKHALTALALLASLPAPALAETNGTLGTTSTGSLTFSLNVTEENRIRIWNLGDMVQTIETGATLEPRSNGLQQFKVNDTDAGSNYKVCIATDDAGLVDLDWHVTPLADGPNIVPFVFQIQKNLQGSLGIGGTLIVNEANIVSEQSGSVFGITAKRLIDDPIQGRCFPNDTRGRIGIIFRHASSQTVDTPGTYVSTLTLTVRPQ